MRVFNHPTTYCLSELTVDGAAVSRWRATYIAADKNVCSAWYKEVPFNLPTTFKRTCDTCYTPLCIKGKEGETVIDLTVDGKG